MCRQLKSLIHQTRIAIFGKLQEPSENLGKMKVFDNINTLKQYGNYHKAMMGIRLVCQSVVPQLYRLSTIQMSMR
jgi:hypothetical protein